MMDPNPSSFPILSYVLGRLPSLRVKHPAEDEYDVERPRPTSSSSSPPQEIMAQHPKLANPKLVATMAKAVADIAQSRSILQTLGPRPDHESVESAKNRIAEIDANLSKQLEEIVLSPRPPEIERMEWRAHLSDKEASCRLAAEKEKNVLKAVVRIDEMHANYEQLLKEAESKLVSIYEKANLDDEEIEESPPQDHVNEEVVRILSSSSDCLDVVDLSNKKLTLLPEAFGRISGLRIFNLSSNQFTMIPDSIGALKKLEELNLASNLIESLPDSIGLLTSLKILNASGNKLTSLPDTICECRALELLDVSFNSLTHLPTNIGHGLTNLKRLHLQLNKLRKLPISICEMQSLQYLDAHFNEIRNLPESFGKLTALETLNLASNFSDLTELPFFFGELSSLKELDLSNNQITELPPTFGLLENLTSLNLDQNPVVMPPEEVVKEGCEGVRSYMLKKWVELLEEEERSAREMKEQEESGWLKRSGSWLKQYASGLSQNVSGYLSPRNPRVPFLDQQL